MRCTADSQYQSSCIRIKGSSLMHEICKLLNISKSRTTAYHPQCDGLVERFNRTLQDMLATTVRDHPFDSEGSLRKVCMAYNSSVNASTGFTPFYLMFGREARLPVDLIYGARSGESSEVNEYVHQLQGNLEAAFELVRQKIIRHMRGARKYMIDGSLQEG